MKVFDLYLDESGSFQDDPQNKQSNPSLIGGLLIESGAPAESIIKKLTSQVHASESYNKDFLKLLQEAKNAGGQFVIFENSERISIINGDITYLNIISEGLVSLFLHLAEKYSSEEISINILIASRLKVSENSAKSIAQITEVIPEKDYLTRLEEKIILAAGRKHLKNINWETSFGSARTNKRLMIADIICNTYITRNAKRKFTEEEQQLIVALFTGALIFPVFENATVGYLRRLFWEQRYSELLCQICTHSGHSSLGFSDAAPHTEQTYSTGSNRCSRCIQYDFFIISIVSLSAGKISFINAVAFCISKGSAKGGS